MRSAIVITVEGLGTSLVGAYGSNTAVTPALDMLAAEGIVFDQCFVDSQKLTRQLSSLASARHALQPSEPNASIWRQPDFDRGTATFLTDSAEAAEWAENEGCQRVLFIEPPQNNEPEDEPAQCAIIALFVVAAEELAESDGGLLWIHSSGLRLPWDAPVDLRRQFIDPEDPEPPSQVQPPAFDVTDSTDPDLVVGWTQVAAAQVALLDDGLASLRSVVDARPDGQSWAWLVVGLGGVPLGEHGRVGWGRSQLHAEELHCVAMVRANPAPAIGYRRAELCQLPDLGSALLQCVGLASDSPAHWGESLLDDLPTDTPIRWKHTLKLALIRSSENEIWIRSPAWSAILPKTIWFAERDPDSNDPPSAAQARLYVKPDDRWEVSEIADRCPDVVDQLSQHTRDFLRAIDEGDRSQLPVIDDQLCSLMR